MHLVFGRAQTRNMAYFLYIMYANFFSLIELLGGGRYIIWGLAFFLLLSSHVYGGKLVFKRKIKDLLAICIGILCIVLFRNQALARGNYANTIRWVLSLSFMFLCVDEDLDGSRISKYIVMAGLVSVLATLYFWINRNAYSVMYSIWNAWPGGTSSGTRGYTAALSDHYSTNGIICAFTCLALFSMLAAKKPENWSRRKRRCIITLLVLSAFALILTSKRAHLMFGIIAALFTYYICNPQKVFERTFKIVVSAVAGVCLLYALSLFVPEINRTLMRFETIGEDTESGTRLLFWSLAWSQFLENPIFGIGWYGFRYEFSQTLSFTRYNAGLLMDPHNVYFQVLCETGIVGFLIYAGILIYLCVSTFSLLRKISNDDWYATIKQPLFFSGVIQVFYLLYSLTGNCLYDVTFLFFCVAVMLSISSQWKYKALLYQKRKGLVGEK